MHKIQNIEVLDKLESLKSRRAIPQKNTKQRTKQTRATAIRGEQKRPGGEERSRERQIRGVEEWGGGLFSCASWANERWMREAVVRRRGGCSCGRCLSCCVHRSRFVCALLSQSARCCWTTGTICCACHTTHEQMDNNNMLLCVSPPGSKQSIARPHGASVWALLIYSHCRSIMLSVTLTLVAPLP